MARLLVFVCGIVAIGCHNVQHLRLADPNDSATASLSEQHEFENGHVLIWWVDGERVREPSMWSRAELELEVDAGTHLIECSFVGGDIVSTENAVLEFQALPGHAYEVRAEVVYEGFWRELGKGFQATLLGSAKGSWAAWIEDKSNREVVAGRRPTRKQ